MRLFVAADLAPLADDIRTAQEPFDGVIGLRLTDPDQAHVTLKFLGETDSSQVPILRSALRETVESMDLAPFTIECGELGVFPSREYIRVIWLGVTTGDTELRRLHEAIEAQTVDLGFDPEAHSFTPHVTLARMDHAGGKDRIHSVLDEREPETESMTLDAVSLMESTLTDDGPVYETVERFELSGED